MHNVIRHTAFMGTSTSIATPWEKKIENATKVASKVDFAQPFKGMDKSTTPDSRNEDYLPPSTIVIYKTDLFCMVGDSVVVDKNTNRLRIANGEVDILGTVITIEHSQSVELDRFITIKLKGVST